MAPGGLVSQQVKLKDAHVQQFNTRVASCSASLLFLSHFPNIWVQSLLSLFLYECVLLKGLTN